MAKKKTHQEVTDRIDEYGEPIILTHHDGEPESPGFTLTVMVIIVIIIIGLLVFLAVQPKL